MATIQYNTTKSQKKKNGSKEKERRRERTRQKLRWGYKDKKGIEKEFREKNEFAVYSLKKGRGRNGRTAHGTEEAKKRRQIR